MVVMPPDTPPLIDLLWEAWLARSGVGGAHDCIKPTEGLLLLCVCLKLAERPE